MKSWTMPKRWCLVRTYAKCLMSAFSWENLPIIRSSIYFLLDKSLVSLLNARKSKFLKWRKSFRRVMLVASLRMRIRSIWNNAWLPMLIWSMKTRAIRPRSKCSKLKFWIKTKSITKAKLSWLSSISRSNPRIIRPRSWRCPPSLPTKTVKL